MIEIVFSESAGGGLKQAQHCGEGPYMDSVAVIHGAGATPTRREIREARERFEAQQRRAWERAVPLGGNPADVHAFSLALNVGDIAQENFWMRRKAVLERLYSVYPYGEGQAAAGELVRFAEERLKTLLTRAGAGEDIRIWYSDQPEELCGFYWMMAQLDRLSRHGKIRLIKLPPWEAVDEKTARHASAWAEVDPEEYHRYLPLEQVADPELEKTCAARWRELQRENAPLRAVKDGQLTGAAETFYDDLIRREIAAEAEEFREAMVIGRVLGKYEPGVGDAFLALRIDTMIRAGELEEAAPAAADEPSYRQTLKRRGR